MHCSRFSDRSLQLIIRGSCTVWKIWDLGISPGRGPLHPPASSAMGHLWFRWTNIPFLVQTRIPSMCLRKTDLSKCEGRCPCPSDTTMSSSRNMKTESTYKGGQCRGEACVPSAPRCHQTSPPAFLRSPSRGTPAGPLPWLPSSTLTKIQWPVKVYTLKKDQQWDNQGTRHVIQLCGATEGPVLLGRVWQNVVYWRREWQTTPVWSGSGVHQKQYEKAKKKLIPEDEPPREEGVQYATGEELRNSSRRNVEAEPKQKWHEVMVVSGGESKVWCCKEQYYIGTCNVRSKNQGKLDVVKQETARVNIDILGISELKWTGMGEFNSDDHYIYYCGQESLRRNGVNKRVQNAVLGCLILLVC